MSFPVFLATKYLKPKRSVASVITCVSILGVMLGVAAVGVRMLLPKNAAGEAVFQFSRDCPFFFTALTTAAKAATPLALVVLGARFDFSAVRALRKQITLGVVMRLVFAPLFAIGGAVLLSKTGVLPFTKVEYPALVGIFASPVAVSSAVMVSEIGGDDQLDVEVLRVDYFFVAHGL